MKPTRWLLLLKAQEGFATALKSDYITKLQEGIDSGKIKEGDGSRMLLDSALEEMIMNRIWSH